MTIYNYQLKFSKKNAKNKFKKKKTYNNSKKKISKGGSNFISGLTATQREKYDNSNFNIIFKDDTKNKSKFQIDDLSVWYAKGKFDEEKEWFPLEDNYFSNFLINDKKDAKKILKNKFHNLMTEDTPDVDYVVWPNDIHTEILTIKDLQAFIPFFIQYNYKYNHNFRKILEEWKNDLTHEKIYEQIFKQIREKYIIKINFNICHSNKIKDSQAKIYFSNLFIKNYEFNINHISELIFNSPIFFKVIKKNIPPNSVSLENFFNPLRSMADVYFPEIFLNNDLEVKDKSFLSLIKSVFTGSDSGSSSGSGSDTVNIFKTLPELGKGLLNLRSIVSSINGEDKDGIVNELRSLSTSEAILFDQELSHLYKSSFDLQTIKDKSGKDFQIVRPNWYKSYTVEGIKRNKQIEQLIEDHKKIKEEEIKINQNKSITLYETFKILNNNPIISTNYLSNNFYQDFLNFNTKNIKKLKEYVNNIKKEDTKLKNKLLEKNKLQKDTELISLARYKVTKILIESNLNIDGQLMLLIPVTNNNTKIESLSEIYNSIIPTNKNIITQWTKTYNGIYYNNQDNNQDDNEEDNIRNILIGELPIIIIIIPLSTILNKKNKNIPFLQNLNFNDNLLDIFPQSFFLKLELVSLVKLLIYNKLIIENVCSESSNLDIPSSIKYYTMINKYIKKIKQKLTNILRRDSTTIRDDMKQIKNVIRNYIERLSTNETKNTNEIKKLSSWKRYNTK